MPNDCPGDTDGELKNVLATHRRFSDLHPFHKTWASRHNISFDGILPSDFARRSVAFAINCNFVLRHNKRFFFSSNGGDSKESFWVRLNRFADTPRTTFRRERLGFNRRSVRTVSPATNRSTRFGECARRNCSSNNATTTVDWRKLGAVNPVKDQGQCGSCYAFSAVAAIESAHFIKTTELVSVSEQEIVDCDTTDEGCNGGLMDNVFEFITANGGVATEKQYPYTARDGSCNAQIEKKDKAVSIRGFQDVTHDDENAMIAAVTKQPVSVAIEADQQAFQLYGGGVFDGTCGTNLDHGVVVVGFTPDAFIVRNSWGADWGESGYIRIARGKQVPHGLCGINMMPSVPLV